MTEENELAHYGILRKSGRYPWGSGSDPFQRSASFQSYYNDLRKKGFSDVEISKALEFKSTTELRAALSISSNQLRAANISRAMTLKQKQYSNTAIAENMGVNESTVRSWLKQSTRDNVDRLRNAADMLKANVEKNTYIDIGPGVSTMVGISATRLKTAAALLKEEEEYQIFYLKVPQLGNPGKFTNTQVLAPKDVKFTDLMKDISQVKTINNYAESAGKDFPEVEPPKSVNSKRVAIRYSDEGGAAKDGVIELRRDVADISLGHAKYAQVRVAVDDTHYLKGMAMYSDKMPDGVDIIFNTNKSLADARVEVAKGNAKDVKHAVMKPIKTDQEGGVLGANEAFGATIRQKHYVDQKGKQQLSPLNIVNEEGAWRDWSKTLSSQMMSKQSPALAKKQLELSYDIKKQEYDDISALTNPVIKKKLLEGFADGAESASVHLKAAGLPRNSNHVILPINSLKDTEIYAPQYRNGEKVVLIRHPHGGKFEIPELTVNNRNREANSLIKQATDAVGINSKVAAQLSGADFDGDTVIVIPNDFAGIKNSAPLSGLKDFDPQVQYKGYEGMKVMSGKQLEMGKVSNLITDMTIKGANENEIARAVRHSMVVIDAEKHKLNYKQSAIDNGISELKEKYQGGANKGASTLISQAGSDIRVDKRKPRSAKDGGPINARTGEKMWEYTGETRTQTKVSKRTGEVTEKTIPLQQISKKMLEVRDAHQLVSKDGGTPIEKVYADYANKLKNISNAARRDANNIKPPLINKSAKQVYSAEVASLTAKLNTALKNKPLERQAQILANAQLSVKLKDNPHLDADDIKKARTQALSAARIRTGADKQLIVITPPEWNAIQSGAVSASRLRSILDNMDADTMKQLATPRDKPVMSPAKIARANSLLAAGYTQAEIADALGVSTSALNAALQ